MEKSSFVSARCISNKNRQLVWWTSPDTNNQENFPPGKLPIRWLFLLLFFFRKLMVIPRSERVKLRCGNVFLTMDTIFNTCVSAYIYLQCSTSGYVDPPCVMQAAEPWTISSPLHAFTHTYIRIPCSKSFRGSLLSPLTWGSHDWKKQTIMHTIEIIGLLFSYCYFFSCGSSIWLDHWSAENKRKRKADKWSCFLFLFRAGFTAN